MADEDGGSRLGQLVAAALTLGFALLLGAIALDMLRRGRKPCGCQEEKAGDDHAGA